jgi:hypothetical protein
VAWNHYHLRGAMRRVLNGTDTPEDLMLVRLAIGANNSSAVQLYRMVPNHRRSDPEAMQRLTRALSIGSLQNANPAATQNQSTLGLPAASAQDAERRGPALPTTAPTLNLGPFQEAQDRTMSEAFLRNQSQIHEGLGDWQVGLDQSVHGSANVTPSNTQHRSDLPDGGSEQNRLPPIPRNESNRSLPLRPSAEALQRANSQQPDSNRRGIVSYRSRAPPQSGTVPSRSTVLQSASTQPSRQAASTQSSSTQTTSQGGSSQSSNNRALESAESGQSPRDATRQGGSNQSPNNRTLESAESGQSPRDATRRGGSSQSPKNRTLESAESGQSPRDATRRGGSSQSPKNRTLESAESGQSPRDATRRGGSSRSPNNRTQSAESVQSPRDATRRGGSSQSPNRTLESAESGQSSANQGQQGSGTELQNTAARSWGCRIS